MAIQDEIRDDLDNEVFGEFGKTVTLTSFSNPTYNVRGELEGSTETESSIVVVPYNIIETRTSQNPFGDLQEGDMDVALRYDQVIAKGDVLTMESEDYKVINIEPNWLPDNVVTIVRVVKVEPLVADD